MVNAACIPRYNPETDGRPQHKNCPGCESLDVISMYTRIARKELQREFSQGDRVQFTAASRELQIVNRELGTIERVSHSGNLEIRMDSGREVRFHNREHPHLDHGYAVTSHSSQGQTADRVLIHVDTGKSERLVNSRVGLARSIGCSDLYE
jgi:ATP-dependent exoDNAse (exonuclease V) alpha subunit